METVTTEKTSKKFKLQILLCWIVFFAGIFAMFSDALCEATNCDSIFVGAGMVVASVVWWIVTKIRIWWNHG